MTHLSTLPNPDAKANDDAGGWTGLYDRVVGALRLHGVGDSAPRAGEVFPDLSLPDTSGKYRALSELRKSGPIIVSFQRGLWCPYCSHELAKWAQVLASLTEAGVKLVIVAGELGERASSLQRLAGESAIMLCDVDHGAALAAGLAFHVDPEMKERYRSCGLDLGEIYGSDGWFLPVPATYVIGADGIVRYAFADPDFRVRADPRDVAALARALV
jgi:peroxiredoxin